MRKLHTIRAKAGYGISRAREDDENVGSEGETDAPLQLLEQSAHGLREVEFSLPNIQA